MEASVPTPPGRGTNKHAQAHIENHPHAQMTLALRVVVEHPAGNPPTPAEVGDHIDSTLGWHLRRGVTDGTWWVDSTTTDTHQCPGGPPAPGHRTLNAILRDVVRAKGDSLALYHLRDEYDAAARALFDMLANLTRQEET